jgi:RNA polymerase sigma-70 factor (ECF subfamily)
MIAQLYRSEYSKMVSVLCSRFGFEQIDAAEDIVSETFLSAAETWGLKGVPDNPVAWLYKVARNNALNGLKHDRVFRDRVRGVLIREASGDASGAPEPGLDFTPEGIADSQLRMLFAVCHPAIALEGQVCLSLRVLCSFGIDEIARALLTNTATVNKRLYRAKEKLRSEHFSLEAVHGSRLDAVLVTLYLLFNEGYYSASPDHVLRKDLCLEAMRLTYLVAQHPRLVRLDVYSLLALMCFQASRFAARLGPSGQLILYEDQDRDTWDKELIDRGNYFFVQACGPADPGRYHLEAAIAWWHTHPADSREKWENILLLYNRLLSVHYTPVAALNRAYAFARVYGCAKAIPEVEDLGLDGNLFYHSLLGELYTGIDKGKAVLHLEMALSLAGSAAEKEVLTRKLSCIL